MNEQQANEMMNALNTQRQNINRIQNQMAQLSTSSARAFNLNIQGTGQNEKDTFTGNLNEATLQIAQQNFWKNVLGTQSTYCTRCGGLAHMDQGACKRRCNRCYGNHNTKDCREKLKCPWCGNDGGLHTCNENSYSKLATRCPLCKTRGHNATECKMEFLVMSRLINVIKSIFKKNKRSKKRKRRRFRGIKNKRK